MRPPASINIATFVATGLIVSGCGGGGGGGTSGPGAQAGINAGAADLGQVIANTSTNPNASLTDATTQFGGSYGIQPSGQAAVGLALAQGALDASSIAQLFGSSVPLLERAGNNMILWKITAANLAAVPKLKSPLEALPINVTGAIKPATSFPVGPTPAQVIAALKIVQTDIGKVLPLLSSSNIQSLETKPLVITYTVSGNTTTIKVGAAEGYALKAAIEAVSGGIDAALAYNLDPGTYNYSASFDTTFATQLASKTPIPASAYLPPAPFLSLNSNGAALLQSMGSTWLAAAADATSATTTLQARTTTGWLANLWNYSSADLVNALADINVFKAALSGPVPGITATNNRGISATLTVNISAWTSGTAPQSLSAFFPTLGPDPVFPTGILDPVPGSIADPTFGGLIPAGMTSDLLYTRYVLVPDNTIPIYAVAAEALAFAL
jgi:hypothetical protein